MDFVFQYLSDAYARNKSLYSNISLVSILAFVLSSCQSVPTTTPTVETIEPVTTEVQPDEGDEVITHALEKDEPVIATDDPQVLVERARNAPQNEAIAFLLLAIDGFIQAEEFTRAQILANQLSVYPLSNYDQISLQLLRVEMNQKMDKHTLALSQLRHIDTLLVTPATTPQEIKLQAQHLTMLAKSLSVQNRNQDAVLALLKRDDLLQDDEQLDNQQQIVSLMLSMDFGTLSGLSENTLNAHLPGWVAIVQILETTDQNVLPFRLEQWRTHFPNHPVQLALLQQYTDIGQFEKYRQIGLLLPLNSPFGSAARAFYDGFNAANNLQPPFDRPEIMLYDTGSETELSSFYYQAAINEGADFIVGPLGRKAVNSWLTGDSIETPTLVISNVPEELAQENLFGISLSPEQEATKVARKAFADGHRQALVFRVDSPWGQRVADAFVVAWEAMGGTITKNASFPTEISDYSRIINKLLNLDKSVTRHKVLSAQLGLRLNFTPRRRDDVDFLFLAANAKQARLIVPQLRFFQAHDLPMYATSYIYSGEPNSSVDADLDGVILGEMKWMLDGVNRHRADKNDGTQAATVETNSENDAQPSELPKPESTLDPTGELTAVQNDSNLIEDTLIQPAAIANLPRSPYADTALDRLYALGFESYQVIPKLFLLRKNEWIQHRGQAMRVSVDKNGNIQQYPQWVTFNKGLLESLSE